MRHKYIPLTSTDIPEKEQEGVYTYLILPILCNSVINHNQFTSIPEPVKLRVHFILAAPQNITSWSGRHQCVFLLTLMHQQ